MTDNPTPSRPGRAWIGLAALWIFGVAAFYYLRLSLLLYANYRDDVEALFRLIWPGMNP